MARVWSTLVVLMVACLVMTSVASAQEKKKGKRDPASIWAGIVVAAEKAKDADEGAKVDSLAVADFKAGVKKLYLDSDNEKKQGMGKRLNDIADKIAKDGKVAKEDFLKERIGGKRKKAE